MKYYLAPPIWNAATAETEGSWSAPAGTLGMIDLRPRPARILAGTLGARAYMFVALADAAAAPAGSALLGQGDLRTLGATSDMQNAWEARLGYRPSGATLLDLLVSQVTDGADVTGSAACEPLMPCGASMELHLGGHSRIWSEGFRWGDRFTAQVQARIQSDFRKLRTSLKSEANAIRARDKARADRLDEQDRRVLDALRERYGCDWKELLPPELRASHPGPLPHETTITESWPTTNTSSIGTGQDQPWAEVLNDSGTSAAGAFIRRVGTGIVRARCSTDLSSADHYSQGSVTVLSTAASRAAMMCARYESGADTCYRIVWTGSSGNFRLTKVEAGTSTDLGTGTTQTVSVPATIKVQIVGSTLSAWFAGASVESITDTSITGHTRIGVGVNGDNSPSVAIDSIEAADIVSAGGGGPIFGGRALGKGRIFGGSALA